MPIISVTGVIETGELPVIENLLSSWLNKPGELEVRSRSIGGQVQYSDDTWDVSCYKTDEGPRFYLSVTLQGTLEMAGASLKKLWHLCHQKGIPCQLDYIEQNEDGDDVGEEFSVTG